MFFVSPQKLSLLSRGAQIVPKTPRRDARENPTYRFPFFSAGKGATGEVIDFLIQEGGCDVNAADATSFRPINKALYYDRHPTIVQALIRNGAQVGFRSCSHPFWCFGRETLIQSLFGGYKNTVSGMWHIGFRVAVMCST